MHSVKLTVLIEDTDDLDMEVRVVVPHAEQHVAGNVTPLPPRAVAATHPPIEDDYALGGYAGI